MPTAFIRLEDPAHEPVAISDELAIEIYGNMQTGTERIVAMLSKADAAPQCARQRPCLLADEREALSATGPRLRSEVETADGR